MSSNSPKERSGQHLDPSSGDDQTGRASPAVRRTCAICLEQIASDRQFGILENCDHIFCHRCIRQWRQSSQQNRLKCPQCRTLSHVMISSFRWFTSADDKQEMFTEKLNEMANKPCAGLCRYGDECRFLHEIDPNVEPVDWDFADTHLDSVADGDSSDWRYDYRNTFDEVMLPPTDAEEGSIFSLSDGVRSSVFDISVSSGVADCLQDDEYERYWSGYVDDMFVHVHSEEEESDDAESNDSLPSRSSDHSSSFENNELLNDFESDQADEGLHVPGRVSRMEISLDSSDDEPMEASVGCDNQSYHNRSSVIEPALSQFSGDTEVTDGDMMMLFDEDNDSHSSCSQNFSSSCCDEYISSCYASPCPSDIETDWREHTQYRTYRNEPLRLSIQSRTSSSNSDHESQLAVSSSDSTNWSEESSSSFGSEDTEVSQTSPLRNSESSHYVQILDRLPLTPSHLSVPYDRDILEMNRYFRSLRNSNAEYLSSAPASEMSDEMSNEDDVFDDDMIEDDDSYSDEEAFSYEDEHDDDSADETTNSVYSDESVERNSPPVELANETRLSELVVRLSILGCPAENIDNDGSGHNTALRRKERH